MIRTDYSRNRARTGAATVVWLMLVIGAPLAAGTWALRVPNADSHLPSIRAETAQGELSDSHADGRPPLDVRILSVSLVDELFPPPAEPPPPPPKPELKLQLIAITRTEDTQRIFVKDQVTGVYLDLGVGDRTARGATLIAIDEIGAVFEIIQPEQQAEPLTLRLELEP